MPEIDDRNTIAIQVKIRRRRIYDKKTSRSRGGAGFSNDS
jgi:hypothetical protein